MEQTSGSLQGCCFECSTVRTGSAYRLNRLKSLMTTRSSLQRNNGAQSFHGHVRKWKRAWVSLGDESTPVAKKRMKVLKWVRTGNARRSSGKGNANALRREGGDVKRAALPTSCAGTL